MRPAGSGPPGRATEPLRSSSSQRLPDGSCRRAYRSASASASAAFASAPSEGYSRRFGAAAAAAPASAANPPLARAPPRALLFAHRAPAASSEPSSGWVRASAVCDASVQPPGAGAFAGAALGARSAACSCARATKRVRDETKTKTKTKTKTATRRVRRRFAFVSRHGTLARLSKTTRFGTRARSPFAVRGSRFVRRGGEKTEMRRASVSTTRKERNASRGLGTAHIRIAVRVRSPPRTFFMLGRFTGFGTESLLAVAIVRPFVCGVETVG